MSLQMSVGLRSEASTVCIVLSPLRTSTPQEPAFKAVATSV